MDTKAALADINNVLAATTPPNERWNVPNVMAAFHRCVSCLERNAAPTSSYRRQAEWWACKPCTEGDLAAGVDALRGLMLGLRADLEAGHGMRFEELVRADLLGDLLAQARHLNGETFTRAAAVLAGAALEEHWNKLGAKHGIPPQKSASDLNIELRKAGVYPEVRRAELDAYYKLRNKAAHGEPGFEAVPPAAPLHTTADVQRMIEGVAAFIAAYPA